MKSEPSRARALRRQLTATFYRKNKATFFVTAGAMLLLGGALLAGLLISWFRSTRPVFGNMPAATSWLFQSLGLCGFIAVVGLSCGPDFVSGLRQNGWGIMWGGIVVTVVPIVSCILAGKWFFKMNPVILLGACTGARLCTAALGALQEACGSPTPVLGYTVPYALNNIIFAVWGVVIVLLMA